MAIKNYEWRSDFAKSHIAKGYAEGYAEALARGCLRVLEWRGISVSDDVRERVARCSDAEQLEAWVKRAVAVDTAEDLFA